MLSHSFDKFYVVTKFKLPKVEDLRLATVQFDSKYSYLIARNHTRSSYFSKLLVYCHKIVPYIEFYKKQISYYNCTAYDMSTNEIGLILPYYPKDWRHNRGIIASVLGGIASSIISLTYEDISSFLHHKRQKALHKAIKIMERKSDIQHNKIHHLEDTMIMYSIYNSHTFAQLIETVHRMHDTTSWREKICRKPPPVVLNSIYIKMV